MNGEWLARVERAGLNATAVPQRLIDGWLVRLSPGKAKRARCVNAFDAGTLALDEKLALCAAAFREAGLPMLVRITPFSMPVGLDAGLQARGWRRIDDTRVMVLDRPDALTAAPVDAASLQPVAAEAFAQRVGELRGSPPAQRQAHAERLANAVAPFNGWVWKQDGVVVACGQFALDGELAGPFDVVTAAGHRGRGIARRLCAHLLAQAARRGAASAYLQVEADNTPARSLYRSLGFVDGYAYHYRGAGAGTA